MILIVACKEFSTWIVNASWSLSGIPIESSTSRLGQFATFLVSSLQSTQQPAVKRKQGLVVQLGSEQRVQKGIDSGGQQRWRQRHGSDDLLFELRWGHEDDYLPCPQGDDRYASTARGDNLRQRKPFSLSVDGQTGCHLS